MRIRNEATDSRPLRIAVLKDRYQSAFMSPRESRHTLVRRRFAPLNLLKSSLDGLTVMAPGPKTDLLHAHNRIPLGARRFIMSFESSLPRRYAWTADNFLVRTMTQAICSHKCRRIVAMSHFARRSFAAQHAGASYFEDLMAKTLVRHPNLSIGDRPDTLDLQAEGPLQLAFVGGHFGRKGGCVAVRIAELAQARGLPVHVTIISGLEVGGAIWTDPTQDGFFDPYFALLNLPNVSFLGSQPNAVVRATLAASHFSLLPTLADTFGYSAVESMAEHTPVIGAAICALPEFIQDGVNGMLLPLETTTIGAWAGLDYDGRGSTAYARRFSETVDHLAEAALARLAPYFEDRAALSDMRQSARATAERMFDAEKAGPLWDALYEEAATEPLSQPPYADTPASISSPNFPDTTLHQSET